PRVSLIKFSDHCHLLLRCDETLNLPLGEPDLFHPRHTPRPFRACRERPRDRRAAEQRDELAASHVGHGASPSGMTIGTERRVVWSSTRRLIVEKGCPRCGRGPLTALFWSVAAAVGTPPPAVIGQCHRRPRR